MHVKMKTILHAFAAVIIFFLTDSFCLELVGMAASVCGSAILLTALYTGLHILNVWISVFLYSKYVWKVSLPQMYLGKPFPALRRCMTALAVPLAVDAVYFIFTKGDFKTGCDTQDELVNILFHEVFGSGFRVAVTEGMIFQGMLFYVIQKGFGKKAGILISAFIYAAAGFILNNGFTLHGADHAGTFLLLFFMGLAFTWITIQTGSVWLSVVIHFWYNVLSGNAYILHIGTRQDFPAVFTYTVRTGSICFTDIPMPSIAVFLALMIMIRIRMKKENQNNAE